jgi:hypothetical protein
MRSCLPCYYPFMKFIPQSPIDGFNLLNIKLSEHLKACPHCHKNDTLKSHGYSHGYSLNKQDKEVRRLRFFCSNRHNNKGCGKTYSLLWSHKIAHTSLIAKELILFILSYSISLRVHKAWTNTKVTFSITTAYRWAKKWNSKLSHIRSLLLLTRAPPINTKNPDINPLLKTLHHLAEVYPKELCCITAFQQQHQVSFL